MKKIEALAVVKESGSDIEGANLVRLVPAVHVHPETETPARIDPMFIRITDPELDEAMQPGEFYMLTLTKCEPPELPADFTNPYNSPYLYHESIHGKPAIEPETDSRPDPNACLHLWLNCSPPKSSRAHQVCSVCGRHRLVSFNPDLSVDVLNVWDGADSPRKELPDPKSIENPCRVGLHKWSHSWIDKQGPGTVWRVCLDCLTLKVSPFTLSP